ncbi:MAG TPA: putative metal-binding motif-containing protein [Kofleriaceae bacterium]|nr:putative metal-binding motif-containing protein [Kofleriaceae bacterium]
MKKIWLGLLVLCSCGGDSRKELFTPKPECKGDPVAPYQGTFPQVISSLQIGDTSDGFDLNGDGKPDNKLAAASSLAMSAIQDSFNNYEIIIPIEFFNLPQVAATKCVKFAIYLANFDPDGDMDGKRPGISGGDCNDNDPSIHPGATEIVGNMKDDDCDGLADEDAQNHPSTDMVDHDGDGYSMAQGDCDDTDPMVHPGMPEICGDGKDNDCDGVADRSVDGSGNVTACSPYAATQDLVLDPRSFDDSGNPQIVFDNGTITQDKDGNLVMDAGPSLFNVNIPVADGLVLDLEITGAQIEATMQPDGTTMTGRLGGVLAANTMDQIRGLTVSEIMLTPDESLLDATFANILGQLLALPKAKSTKTQKDYPGCLTPDIDVDGDGLEAFCDSDPTDDKKVVDTCIDGDGTVVHDVVDDMGNVTMHCAQATDSHGKPRFVDGVSVELNFQTTLIHSIKAPPSS